MSMAHERKSGTLFIILFKTLSIFLCQVRVFKYLGGFLVDVLCSGRCWLLECCLTFELLLVECSLLILIQHFFSYA